MIMGIWHDGDDGDMCYHSLLEQKSRTRKRRGKPVSKNRFSLSFARRVESNGCCWEIRSTFVWLLAAATDCLAFPDFVQVRSGSGAMIEVSGCAKLGCKSGHVLCVLGSSWQQWLSSPYLHHQDPPSPVGRRIDVMMWLIDSAEWESDATDRCAQGSRGISSINIHRPSDTIR